MDFDFIKLKENDNLISLKIEGKKKYYLDLLNIEHSLKLDKNEIIEMEKLRKKIITDNLIEN